MSAYTENFDRPDGPVDGWISTTNSGGGGSWSISGGALTVSTPDEQHGGYDFSIWAGDPSIVFTRDIDISFDYVFLDPGHGREGVGRHGGVSFLASGISPGRGGPYTLDWIDRIDDHGFRWNASGLGVGGDNPPVRWRIRISGGLISIYGDGKFITQIVDSEFQQGVIGFWAWAGQVVSIDNLVVQPSSSVLTACFKASNAVGIAAALDASCSDGPNTITAYDWDFGDGQVGSGASVKHDYAAVGTYTVTLKVTDSQGNTDSRQSDVSVVLLTDTFTDDFTRADGPVDGWTDTSGVWTITGNEFTATIGEESSVWIGDPTIAFTRNIDIAFDYSFLDPGPEGVGRHGGITIFAPSESQGRGNGYTLDWLDVGGGFRWNGASLKAGGADPPTRWRIRIHGDLISFYGDGAFLGQVVDTRLQQGVIGFWGYNSQIVSIDNVVIQPIDKTLTSCFDTGPTAARLPVSIDFDAACSSGPDALTAYEWDFGDGSQGTGKSITHAFATSGNKVVKLKVTDSTGKTDTRVAIVRVISVTDTFSDNFNRADGPVDGWTDENGSVWSISGGELTATTSGESSIWAGDPPIQIQGDVDISFKYTFLDPGPGGVGRHGGVTFFASETSTGRGSGYYLDWIDRQGDHGFRWRESPVGFGGDDPPTEWRIRVDGERIYLYGDGVLVNQQIIDSGRRQGLIGFWAYAPEVVSIDDLVIKPTTPEVIACFTNGPTGGQPPISISFDGTCSHGPDPITSYDWDFGDGGKGTGDTITHDYAAAGTYQVFLKVTDSRGGSSTTMSSIKVIEIALEYCDDFSRADGPVDGWTDLNGGVWAITAGELSATTGNESSVWIGDPPLQFQGDIDLSFTYQFLDPGPEGVGRHGGVTIFAPQAETYRGNGYGLDWLDRDGGFRWNGNRIGEPAVDPPAEWRVVIVGETISIYGDGALIGEVTDSSLRQGVIGFWAYSPEVVVIDNVKINNCGTVVPTTFHRGDADANGNLNITDAIFILNYLFIGGSTPTCLEAANVNDDAAINISDGIVVLNFLFLGGPPPATPGPPTSPCGPDPVGSPAELGCISYDRC